MKKISLQIAVVFILLCILISVQGCKPTPSPSPATTQYTIQFNLTASGSSITTGQAVTAPGGHYYIDLLRFYLGFPRLVKTDGTEVPMSNLCIVALDKYLPYNSIYGNTFTFSVPAGDYKAVRFGVGLPPAINDTVKHYHNGPFDPLNQVYGLVWQMSFTFRDIALQMYTDTSKAQNLTPTRPLFVHVLEDGDTLNLYHDLEFDKAFTISSGSTFVDNFNIDANQVFFPSSSPIDIKTAGSTDMTNADKTGIALGLQLDNNFAKAISKQ